MNVVIYTRVNTPDDDKISELVFHLERFCDMVGSDAVDWFWDYTDNPKEQKNLSHAITSMWDSTEKAILTYDLNSLCADTNRALELIADIHEQGGFVYFIDPYAVKIQADLWNVRN